MVFQSYKWRNTVYANYFYDTSVIFSNSIITYREPFTICIGHDRRTDVIGIDWEHRCVSIILNKMLLGIHAIHRVILCATDMGPPFFWYFRELEVSVAQWVWKYELRLTPYSM